MTVPAPGSRVSDLKPILLTKFQNGCTAPSWSPDGTKLAFCANVGNTRQIWCYDFKTGQEVQLTQGGGNKENPTWAPDSRHLVYNTSDRDRSELYLIGLNRLQPICVSSGPGEKHFPSWQPR